MKKILLIALINIFIVSVVVSQTIVFYENFESISIPNGWTQEKVVGSSLIPWITKEGGHQGNPPSAYQGIYNAFFQYQSYDGETTKLITPPLDLSNISKPELRFAHAQDIWTASGNDWWDKLKIYYKRGEDSAWVLIQEYLDPVQNWTMRSILLPDSSLSSTYYLAFEGITGYGHGVCVDTVRVIETGLIPKYLESLDVTQVSTSFIATGTQHNPVLRIDLNVMGNDGSLLLDSIAINSLNTSDSDISNNGVKLFATTTVIFSEINLLDSGNFSSGIVIFDDLNFDIPRGYSYLWVTYDIKTDLNHELHGHVADAKIDANSININSYLYPYVDKSPSGSRIIYETLLYDNFETDKGWRYTGEFERNTPMGKIGLKGLPDPSEALSGINVIGTDLTGDGMYSNSLPDTAYVAEAPTLNCKYYKDIYLTFYRWLNIDLFDNSRILASSDNINWITIWQNQSFYTDNAWNLQQFNLSSYFTREEQARLKFTLGPTNSVNQYTGWNIDDVVIIGNYISKDVGVTNWIAPVDGCGHTGEEKVTITIKNFAGDTLFDPLPVNFSFDGGTTIYFDTIQAPNIPIDGSIDYEITKSIDLTTPGWYNNVYVTTNLPGDEDATNNKLTKVIFIVPTYSLPYTQNFETNYGYYRSGGTNSTWAYGTPAITNPVINSAASGTKTWVTNLSGDYSDNDSSYLESPCFNFTGTDSIIFEFKCKGLSEDKTDGLSILYSLNEGVNWNLVPNDHDYYWNWYNETNISTLEQPGIDETSDQWLTFRQLLPSEFSDQSSVKFRFVFESNESVTYEGFGIDDIKIYEAPYDVGVFSMTYPFDSCKWNDTTHVKVLIKNYGPTDIKSGTTIPLVLKFNSTTISENLVLTSNLTPNTTTLYTFSSTVDMSYAGTYNFTVYTKLESNTFFYNDTVSNDTLYTTASVTGMPRYNPFPILIGDNPIDTFLVAGQGYVSYEWTRPVLPDTTAYTTDTLFLKTNEGWYKVTVTNDVGCTAADSVEIVNSEIDLKMDTIYTELIDSCERNVLSEISVRFINNSFNDLNPPADTVFLAYQINNLPIVKDTLILTGTIATSDSADFTFTEKADFTVPDNYTLKVFIDILKDLNHTNDTANKVFTTKGYVDISFVEDTIFSSNADTVILSPTPLYSTYTWSTLETTSTITNLPNTSQWYKVTVTDLIVCDPITGQESDSIYVETYDIAIITLDSPTSRCENNTAGSTDINVKIKNLSGNTYNSSTPLTFMYNFNGGGWIEKNLTLGTTLNPNGETNLSVENIVRTSPGEYTLEVYLKSAIDANNSNDSINVEFETYPVPHVDLAYDTIFTTQADTLVLIASPDLFSYLWNTGNPGDTTSTLTVTDPITANYVVEVTDEHGCDTDSDSTFIITYNLGVSSLITPNNACQHTANEAVKIAVKNYGQDIFTAGTSIPVGYIFNGTPVNETLILGSDLNPSQVVYYTFTTPVNLTNTASYNFKLFTDFVLDASHTNDTLIDVIKTFGYPTIEIGDDIYTSEPETLTLVAPSGYNYYKWNDGTLTNTLSVTYPATKLYSVTVTDINGCSTSDQLTVYTYDIGVASINTPYTTCEFTNDEVLNISILNNSQDTLFNLQTINVSYSFNGGAAVNEVLTLSGNLLPDSTADYSFPLTLDLTTATSHNIEVSCAIPIDVNASNDNLSVDIDAVGYPSFTLGDDIFITNPVGTVLTAPGGYASYEWQDASTNSTFAISNPASAQYAVTVTDAYGCEGSDTLEVYTYNVAASQLITPISKCVLTATETVSFSIINNSQDVLLSGETISVSYTLNSGIPVIGSFNLSANLLPGNTVNYTFTQKANLSTNQVHEFELFAKLANIDVKTDDKIIREVDYQKPLFDLGADVNTGAAQHVIDAGAGYTSYAWFDGSTTTQTYTVDINNQNPNHYYAVEVTNSYGCTDEDSIQVTFTTTPDLSVTNLYSPVSDCWQASETYPVNIVIKNSGLVNLNPGTSFTVGYKIDGGSSVTETFDVELTAMKANDTREHTFADEISFASAKVYEFKTFIKLSNDVSAGNDTLTRNIDISAPEVILGVNDTIYFTNPIELSPTESYLTYLWSDGSDGPTLIINTTGTYSVTITDQYGCSGEGRIYCENSTGIDNLIQGDGYKISYYPNPVSDQLMIQFDNTKSADVLIEFLSSNGQLLYRTKLKIKENTIEQIDVNSYANGVYYIRFNINNELFTRKIIIQ